MFKRTMRTLVRKIVVKRPDETDLNARINDEIGLIDEALVPVSALNKEPDETFESSLFLNMKIIELSKLALSLITRLEESKILLAECITEKTTFLVNNSY